MVEFMLFDGLIYVVKFVAATFVVAIVGFLEL